MEKTVIILTIHDIWSMGDKSGAPSCYRTIDGYAENGWNVRLVVPYSEQKFSFEKVNVETVRKYNHSQGNSKLGKFGFNLSSWMFYTREMLRTGEKILRDEIEKGNKVLMYAYEVQTVKAAKILSVKYKVPLVTRFQGTIMAFKKNNFINHIAYVPHYQALKTEADMIVMTDDGSFGEQYLRQIGNKSPILFLRNGVDIRSENATRSVQSVRSDLGIRADEKVLMTLSRLVGWKRLDRSICAMPEILRGNRCKLVIIGDGDSRPKLEEMANKLGVSDQVIFLGNIPQKNVADYLNIADIFLSLYDLGNLGNPTYEAMFCGKAIISLNNGDTESVLHDGENSRLLSPETICELPSVVNELLQDERERNRLGNNAKEYAQKNFWTWEERMKFECQQAELLLKMK